MPSNEQSPNVRSRVELSADHMKQVPATGGPDQTVSIVKTVKIVDESLKIKQRKWDEMMKAKGKMPFVKEADVSQKQSKNLLCC